MDTRTFSALVVGGGVVGLAALERLSALAPGPVALIEARRVGHALGSSHGAARIARSTYPDPLYVRLMARARTEDWPRLERDSGRRLVHPTPMCLFGPAEGPFEAYARAVDAAAPGELERLAPAEAARAFPELRFDAAAGALVDRTAGIVDAAGTLAALRELSERRGARVLEQTRCEGIALEDPIRVTTTRGELRCERLILAASAWTARLLPELAPQLTPLSQTVAYFEHERGALGQFAPWAWLGAGDNGIHYGLPAFGGEGIKVARHRTSGDPDDPERDEPVDPRELEPLREVLDSLLARPPGRLLRAERCLYTMTPSEDPLLERHPRDPRVTVCAGLSGHGFKLAPLLGRALAERTASVTFFSLREVASGDLPKRKESD